MTLSGANGAVSFDVTFTPPANANVRLFGGCITLTPNSDPREVVRRRHEQWTSPNITIARPPPVTP